MKKNGSNLSPGTAKSKGKGGVRSTGGASGAQQPLEPEVKRWLAAAATGFSASQSSIIPMLQSAQATLGYLPRDAMHAIARHVGVPPATVEGVASFYAQFRFNKPGRNRITVCTGTACYVRGSGKLLDDIKTDLKINSGETTEDGAVSLESVSCFGACALAPVVVLNGKVLRQQSSDSVKQIIQDISDDPSSDDFSSRRSPSNTEGARQ